MPHGMCANKTIGQRQAGKLWVTASTFSIMLLSKSKPHPSKPGPTPATCHKRKQKLRCKFRKVALQQLHCNICFSAVQMSILPASRAATNEKLHCNIEKAALQASGAFLPPSCGFQAPALRHPRLRPADLLLLCLSRLGARKTYTYVDMITASDGREISRVQPSVMRV